DEQDGMSHLLAMPTWCCNRRRVDQSGGIATLKATATDKTMLRVLAALVALGVAVIAVAGIFRSPRLLEAAPLTIGAILFGGWLSRYAVTAGTTIPPNLAPWWSAGWAVYVVAHATSRLLYHPRTTIGLVFWAFVLTGGVFALVYGFYRRARAHAA